jgi:glycosyltransferase involved in cell wall biosynthesis
VTTVVYLSHTGALEPLGRSQVLPYLRGLSATGVRFVLVTFEKPADLADAARVAETRRALAEVPIEWHPLTYRRGLLGKCRNLLEGAGQAWHHARRSGAALFHARSHAAAAMALVARALHGGALLFDLRGEVAEEYADIGHWSRRSLLYRATRALEHLLVRRSDGLVVLTERLARRLQAERKEPPTVIPCCVDRALFRPGAAGDEDPGLPAGRPTLVYSGSVGTWYLFAEMLALARVAERECGAQFLLLTRAAEQAVREAAGTAGLGLDRVLVRSPHYEDVPRHLRRCTAGVAFVRPVPSKQGSSPTKIAEYLACGLPVIANAGVGDLEDFVEKEGVGVVLRSFGEDELRRAARFLGEVHRDPRAVRERCLAVAEQRFDLTAVGVARYRALYGRLGVP